jgi:glycosyltransferase involved in cell wall biosynthesis
MRNEERFIASCLDPVLAQLDGFANCEIICVDGASTDQTREIVSRYAQKDHRVHLMDNPRKIVPVAMNMAIKQAKGDVIIRLDCHAEYAGDYVCSCLEVLSRTEADNVGGYLTTKPGEDTGMGRAIAAATSSRFGVGDSAFRTGGPEQDVDTVPFGCFQREVFDRYGLYDERLIRNQDIEFNGRIKEGGGRIIISPKIRLTYFNQATLKGLWRQAFRNGLWNPYTVYLIGGGLQTRHFVPLIFVLSIVVFALGGIISRSAWLALSTELLLYAAFGTAVALKASKRNRSSAGLVVLSFIVLHVAYGIGSLVGILTAPSRFGDRRRNRVKRTAERPDGDER